MLLSTRFVRRSGYRVGIFAAAAFAFAVQSAHADKRLVIMLDRTGSMTITCGDGQTRCQQALNMATSDLFEFFSVYASENPKAAVWTFTDDTATQETAGFVSLFEALNALDALNGAPCGGLTPLAEAMCDGALALAGEGGTADDDLQLTVYTDGGENYSDGPCSGPYSTIGPPPPGNYDVGSWQKKVWNTAVLFNVLIRHWPDSVPCRGDSGINPETGEPRGSGGPSDAAFFYDLATASGGVYTVVYEGHTPPPIFGGCSSGSRCPEADVNCDDVVNGLDIAIISSSANFGLSAANADEPRADVNGDGSINGLDVAAASSSNCFGR